MALGQEHVRWIALPNGQLPGPRALARRPTRPHTQPPHHALTVVVLVRFFVRCRGRPRNVSASSPSTYAHTLRSLSVLDDACRTHPVVVFPYGGMLDYDSDCHAAACVCRAGADAFAERDLFPGSGVHAAYNPGPYGLGRTYWSLLTAFVINSPMIVSFSVHTLVHSSRARVTTRVASL